MTARSTIPLLTALALVSFTGAATATAPDPLAQTAALLFAGRYVAAESTARVCVARAAASPGRDSSEYAAAIELLADALWREPRPKTSEALTLARTSLRIRERNHGPESLEAAMSLGRIADVFRTMGSPDTARAIYERALSIVEMTLGPDRAEAAPLIAGIARCFGTRNWVLGKPYAERALAIREKSLPPDDPDIARSCHLLGSALRQLNDMRGAREYLERARAIREKSLGPSHPDLAWTLAEIGKVCANTGDYANGRKDLERAIAIFEDPAAPDSGGAARARQALGYLLTQSGDFGEARRLLEWACVDLERVFGPDAALFADGLGDYGNLLLTTGDFAAAQTVLGRGYAVCERALGRDSHRLGYFALKLANVALLARDYPRAESLFTRALGIKERLLGPQSPDLVAPLEYLGEVTYHRGDYDRARAYSDRALTIELTTHVHGELGPENMRINLARIDRALGHLPEATTRFRDAIVASERVIGLDHPDIGNHLAEFADLLLEDGETTASLDTALRAEAIGREHQRLYSRALSERQALDYSEVRGTGLPVALTLVWRGLGASDRARVWNSVIRSRALVLDEMAERHRAAGNGPHAKALAEASARLANLTVRGPGDEAAERYRMELEAARRDRERAERELAESDEARGGRDVGETVGLDEVASRLPPSSALVAFVEFDRHEARARLRAGARPGPPDRLYRTTPCYLAFVLRAGEREPSVVTIGDRARVDSLIARWGEEVSGRAHAPGSRSGVAAYRAAGTALRREAWDPVARRIGGASRVFVVPDGALNLVSLATLPDAKNGYLAESGPLIHLLSAERDLAQGPHAAPGSGLLALGGAAFDATPRVAAATEAPASASGSLPVTFRGERSHCADFRSLRWADLPATGVETREVAALWDSSRRAEVARDHEAVRGGVAEAALVLTGDRADETTFKSLAPGRRALHIATHGFFLAGDCRATSSGTRGIGVLAESAPARIAGPSPTATEENPLLLSGLILAGANRRESEDHDRDDGVLTAEEVSALDLGGVEWAVLSACETGVGEVRAGEGVFGLRRAFEIAGARTLVMSLWSVEDQSARAWMKSLYEARFVRGLGTAESVRAASVQLLRARRARGESTHPFFWGGFVAAGDWR